MLEEITNLTDVSFIVHNVIGRLVAMDTLLNNKKRIMKIFFLTFVGVALLTTVTLAQSPEESQRDKNSGKDNAIKRDHSTQDTIQRESTRPEPGVGVSESNESNNSKAEEKETVTQKEKTNKPGLRSQTDEDETGKKRKRSENNPG